MVLARTLCLLLAATALAGCASAAAPSSSAARHTMRSIFQDDCLLVQLDADPHCNHASRARALNAMRSLGADTIKMTVIRDKVQSYGWGPFDATVGGTLARGMTPFLSLTDRGRTPRVGAFARFVRASVEHFPKVHLWSIYNEPNRVYFLRSASPRAYRRLFVASQAALRKVRGHRHDTVLMGELAPRATGRRATPIGPLAFTREVFCLDPHLRPYAGTAARRRGCRAFRRITASGLAVHPYTNGRGLAAPNTVDPGDAVSVATMSRLTRIVNAAAARGRTNRMPIWDTELGFQSRPPDPLAPSLARQAEYLNWSDWLQWRNLRVASVSQYDLDDTRIKGSYNTGLRFFRGGHKPSWAAYRLPLLVTTSGRGSAVVWGQVRPGGASTVRVEKQARGHGRFRTLATLRTNPAGYFQRRFHGGGRDRWRLAWRRHTSRVAIAR